METKPLPQGRALVPVGADGGPARPVVRRDGVHDPRARIVFGVAEGDAGGGTQGLRDKLRPRGRWPCADGWGDPKAGGDGPSRADGLVGHAREKLGQLDEDVGIVSPAEGRGVAVLGAPPADGAGDRRIQPSIHTGHGHGDDEGGRSVLTDVHQCGVA